MGRNVGNARTGARASHQWEGYFWKLCFAGCCQVFCHFSISNPLFWSMFLYWLYIRYFFLQKLPSSWKCTIRRSYIPCYYDIVFEERWPIRRAIEFVGFDFMPAYFPNRVFPNQSSLPQQETVRDVKCDRQYRNWFEFYCNRNINRMNLEGSRLSNRPISWQPITLEGFPAVFVLNHL